jgi:hypothetical protein
MYQNQNSDATNSHSPSSNSGSIEGSDADAGLPQTDLFHILKSLTYFKDAEADGDPKMLQKLSTHSKSSKHITNKNHSADSHYSPNPFAHSPPILYRVLYSSTHNNP